MAGFKSSADYLKSLEKDLKRCVELGQYSTEYLAGYKGAISCLEFAAREYESKDAEALRETREKCGSRYGAKPEKIVLQDSDELVEQLVRITRMLALLEGIAL